jgi:polar amino acid transport system substrate-binding protein
MGEAAVTRSLRTSERHVGGRVALVLAALLVAGCGSTAQTPATSTAGDPGKDKLAEILARGTLVLSNSTTYPPQSMLVPGATRPENSKCTNSQLTAAEVTGYDVETGKALAKGLGVEPCFVSPPWAEVVSGSWGDRWDIAYRSGAINSDRMKRLWMTQPYRAEPSRFFVRADSAYSTPADLSGKAVGACADCSHELYLKGSLVLPGLTFVDDVKNPKVVTYSEEPSGLKAVADGKIDAFLCAEQEGKAAIASGLKLRPLDQVAFTSMLTGLVDKSSGLDDAAFVARVDQIIEGLHKDGTLARLSQKFYGTDYAAAAGRFDLGLIGQSVS